MPVPKSPITANVNGAGERHGRIRQRAELVACSCRRSAPAPASPDPSPSAGRWPTPRASPAPCRCSACPAAAPKSGSGCTRWSSPTATSAPVSSRTSTSAGPYGFDRHPIESHRGGCTHCRSSSSTSFAVPPDSRPEVERAPGDQRGLVRQPGEVDVRFGVEFRHTDLYIADAARARPASRRRLPAGQLQSVGAQPLVGGAVVDPGGHRRGWSPSPPSG